MWPFDTVRSDDKEPPPLLVNDCDKGRALIETNWEKSKSSSRERQKQLGFVNDVAAVTYHVPQKNFSWQVACKKGLGSFSSNAMISMDYAEDLSTASLFLRYRMRSQTHSL